MQIEYQPYAVRLAQIETELAALKPTSTDASAKADKTAKLDRATAKKRQTLEKQRERMTAKLAERDERIAETRRRAEDDRQAVDAVGAELRTLYTDPDELLKHARVVDIAEIAENEYNLNIPRYVDTFEPEARVSVEEALQGLAEAERALRTAEDELRGLLKAVGYEQ